MWNSNWKKAHHVLISFIGIGLIIIGTGMLFQDTKKYVETNLIEANEIEKQIEQEIKQDVINQIEELKLEIPKWNWERIIKWGTVDQIHSAFGTLLKGNQNNLVIAGHDIDAVFHDMQKIKIGMEVLFTINGIKTKYEVIKTIKVWPNQVEYLEETNHQQLTLITCTDNDTKRLIVICSKVNL